MDSVGKTMIRLLHVGYVPAEKKKKKEDARLFSKNEDREGEAGLGTKKTKGQKKNSRLGGRGPCDFLC